MNSSPLRWADLRQGRIGVWGVGKEGRATLAKLRQLGVVPVAVVDDLPRDHGVLATATGGLDALVGCDVVVKAPGISRYSAEVEELERHNVAVVGGIGLWLEEIKSARVIGITGTKGKSTTTSIAGHLARGLGYRCFVGGNLGTVPWDPQVSTDVDVWIVEISSYQATDVWSSPAVTAVTSLHPDHLNWHGSLERYYEDKLSLCGRRGAVITIANGSDERLRDRAAALVPGPRWIDIDGSDWSWSTALRLRGVHNVTNALIAAACLEEMGIAGADDPERLEAAAHGYEPLPHRLETIAVKSGVEYVDDSLSTNVLPTIVAAKVFADQPLALIVGGFERDIDYAPLGEFLAARVAPSVALTLPENGDRIFDEVVKRGGQAIACGDLLDAVRAAAAWAEPGAVVLLSPAAASYGHFANYLERSEVFRQAVEALP